MEKGGSMYSFTILLVIAVLGGVIAYVGDKLGTKIGKKRISVLDMRPKHSSILITVLTGMFIAALTIGVMAYVSEDARIALFGIENIKNQLHDLTDSVSSKNKEIEFTQKILIEKNRLLADVDKNISMLTGEKQKAEQALVVAQKEAMEARALKQQLQSEVEELNIQASKLREGIKTVRQGQIIFQAGEVVGGGVLKTGIDEEKNQQELNRFLEEVNVKLMQHLQIKDKNMRILQVGDLVVKELLTHMKQAEGSIYVRLLAAGNLVYGDPVFIIPQVLPNKLLYPRASIIHERVVDMRGQDEQKILVDVLKAVNAAAIAQGAIPDPMTGTVGDMPISDMLNITNDFKRNSNMMVKITVIAKKDIYIADNLAIDIVIEKVPY